MKSRKIIAGALVSKVITAATLVFFTLSGSAIAGDEKVKVCHFPSGDKTKGKVISVAKSSLKAHLKKGAITQFYNDVKNGRCFAPVTLIRRR